MWLELAISSKPKERAEYFITYVLLKIIMTIKNNTVLRKVNITHILTRMATRMDKISGYL